MQLRAAPRSIARRATTGSRPHQRSRSAPAAWHGAQETTTVKPASLCAKSTRERYALSHKRSTSDAALAVSIAERLLR
jgi:hypothetical protein